MKINFPSYKNNNTLILKSYLYIMTIDKCSLRNTCDGFQSAVFYFASWCSGIKDKIKAKYEI